MNKNTFGVICANYENTGFGPLLQKRTLASLPFGGRYRMVDFPLSAMVHAGITTIGLIMPFYYRSLMDHVGTGKPWSLDRKIDGLFALPGSAYAQSHVGMKTHVGDLGFNKRFLERRRPGTNGIFMAASNVCNIDLKPIIEFHENSGKPVTFVYYIDKDGNKQYADICVASRDEIMDIITKFHSRPFESLHDAITEYENPKQINEYIFEGYIRCIDNVQDYIQANMDLLNPKIHEELFNSNRIIYTKTQDEAPAHYTEGSSVKNSIVSAGCLIEGKIENCISDFLHINLLSLIIIQRFNISQKIQENRCWNFINLFSVLVFLNSKIISPFCYYQIWSVG